MLKLVTALAFALHIGGGAVGLVSGLVAAFAPKGGPLHRVAGNVFFAAMLLMGLFAIYLAVVMPDQLVNVFIGVFALYLVTTAWLTARRSPGAGRLPERIALAVALILWAPFAVLSFQLATGLPPLFRSAVPLKGPVAIAIYSFTAVLSLAVIGDGRVAIGGGLAGVSRISRHLWRMCLGLTLALGSSFTNGLARLLPGPYHVPPAFFLPQFLPLGLIAFWMIRVRLRDWRPARTASASGGRR